MFAQLAVHLDGHAFESLGITGSVGRIGSDVAQQAAKDEKPMPEQMVVGLLIERPSFPVGANQLRLLEAPALGLWVAPGHDFVKGLGEQFAGIRCAASQRGDSAGDAKGHLERIVFDRMLFRARPCLSECLGSSGQSGIKGGDISRVARQLVAEAGECDAVSTPVGRIDPPPAVTRAGLKLGRQRGPDGTEVRIVLDQRLHRVEDKGALGIGVEEEVVEIVTLPARQ